MEFCIMHVIYLHIKTVMDDGHWAVHLIKFTIVYCHMTMISQDTVPGSTAIIHVTYRQCEGIVVQCHMCDISFTSDQSLGHIRSYNAARLA